MSLFMSQTCPHCAVEKAPIRVVHLHFARTIERGGRDASIDLNAAGVCDLCNRMIVSGYAVLSPVVEISRATLDNWKGDLSGHFTIHTKTSKAQHIFSGPSMKPESVPEHLPDRILKPFLDAEKAFSHGIWGIAAAGYRKAVDRAVTPLIGDAAKGKMLGPKIGMLEKTGLLPPAMLDWIRIVKDDGNFALHDDDHDFDRREQVEPAREFAFTLLTYLFTLPEKVRIARGLPLGGLE